MAAGCPLLEVLDLGWCEIGDAALGALARRCPHLTMLNLAYCDAISDGGLRLLCRGCARLVSLDVVRLRPRPECLGRSASPSPPPRDTPPLSGPG